MSRFSRFQTFASSSTLASFPEFASTFSTRCLSFLRWVKGAFETSPCNVCFTVSPRCLILMGAFPTPKVYVPDLPYVVVETTSRGTLKAEKKTRNLSPFRPLSTRFYPSRNQRAPSLANFPHYGTPDDIYALWQVTQIASLSPFLSYFLFSFFSLGFG